MIRRPDILTSLPPFSLPPSLSQHINSYKVGPPGPPGPQGNLIFSLQYQARSLHWEQTRDQGAPSRHVSLRYFCQAATLYESRTTWENCKQPTRLQPTPLLLLNFLLCSWSSDSINIFHSPNGLSFLCMEFVTNCLYLDILIRWLQWKTETADAGDISLLFPLSDEISFCVILT